MTQMDDELRRALRRVEPPAGFAERVLQNVSSSKRAVPASPTRPQVATAWPMRWAIAATLVAAIGGGLWYRADERQLAERRQTQQGEEAKRQVLMTLSLAGSKLQSVQIRVNHGEER